MQLSMANYESLKTAIANVIKPNGKNEINGSLLQNSLLAMIDSLGTGYQFEGIATPITEPGTPDQNVFYFATEGTYPNFDSAIISEGELGIFCYNGSWTIHKINIGSGGSDLIDVDVPGFHLIDANGYIIATIDENGVASINIPVYEQVSNIEYDI